MSDKIVQPYGMWGSPFSAAMLSQRLRLDDVQWCAAAENTKPGLIWLEGRSDQSALVYQPPQDARRDLTDDQNVRGGVGYGGGEFCAGHSCVIYAERSGRLFRRSLGYGRPQPVTPPFGSVASPVLSADESLLIYVFSDGKTDLLALTDLNSGEWAAPWHAAPTFTCSPPFTRPVSGWPGWSGITPTCPGTAPA